MHRIPEQTGHQTVQDHRDRQHLDRQAILAGVEPLRAVTLSIDGEVCMHAVGMCGGISMQTAHHFPPAGSKAGFFQEFALSGSLYTCVGRVDNATW